MDKNSSEPADFSRQRSVISIQQSAVGIQLNTPNDHEFTETKPGTFNRKTTVHLGGTIRVAPFQTAVKAAGLLDRTGLAPANPEIADTRRRKVT